MHVYTPNGRELQISGEIVYTKSHIAVGRIRNRKVYGADGRYVGTLVGARLVYRSQDSGRRGPSFWAENRNCKPRAPFAAEVRAIDATKTRN